MDLQKFSPIVASIKREHMRVFKFFSRNFKCYTYSKDQSSILESSNLVDGWYKYVNIQKWHLWTDKSK